MLPNNFKKWLPPVIQESSICSTFSLTLGIFCLFHLIHCSGIYYCGFLLMPLETKVTIFSYEYPIIREYLFIYFVYLFCWFVIFFLFICVSFLCILHIIICCYVYYCKSNLFLPAFLPSSFLPSFLLPTLNYCLYFLKRIVCIQILCLGL